MRDNPFTLRSESEPNLLINHGPECDWILDLFSGKHALAQTCLIEGSRGSGKTVLMTTVAKELEKREEWIVVNLNSARNLLGDLARSLQNTVRRFPDLIKQEVSISVAGFGINGSGEPADSVIIIENVLRALQKKKKKPTLCF